MANTISKAKRERLFNIADNITLPTVEESPVASSTVSSGNLSSEKRARLFANADSIGSKDINNFEEFQLKDLIGNTARAILEGGGLTAGAIIGGTGGSLAAPGPGTIAGSVAGAGL